MSSITDQTGLAALCLRRLRLLERRRSERHRIALYEHPELGRVLTLDGEIHHVEKWAPLYHESIVHIPLMFVRRPRSALIIGGGSLYAANEILKYPSIQRVVMVDHDEEVVAICEKHYAHARRCRRDRRLHLLHADGFKYIDAASEHFDLVVNDALDLAGVRRTRVGSVYDRLASTLTAEGVCSDVVYRHVLSGRQPSRTLRELRQSFQTAAALVYVPEYPGVLHLLTMWGRSRRIQQGLRRSVNPEHGRWSHARGRSPCQYFDARFVRHHLYLPPYILRLLAPRT